MRCGSSGGSVSLDSCRDFCLVDFGLSKSLVVPEDSPVADRLHPWPEDRPWMRPAHFAGKGCYRTPREAAEFRGTSMYASLRVHQEKDYCPRDDIWSLMYVFCDLVSGGLPWMQNAANRDRVGCYEAKLWVHGDSSNSDGSAGAGAIDRTEELLKGDVYHVAVYSHQEKHGKNESALLELSKQFPPLELSRDTQKVQLLRKAFRHLATLEFHDLPDYDLIQECIRGFLKGPLPQEDLTIKPVDWAAIDERMMMSPANRKSGRVMAPRWDFVDDHDALDEDIFEDAEETAKADRRADDYLSRLPVETRFRLAQLDYNLNAHKSGTLPPHRALRDWMQLALPLLYDDWDARKFEDGGHRTSTDGFKRDIYLRLLRQCEAYATTFDNFSSREYYYEVTGTPGTGEALESESGAMSTESLPPPKKRKVTVKYSNQEQSKRSDLVFVARAVFGIKRAVKSEATKNTAPPVPISFGN